MDVGADVDLIWREENVSMVGFLALHIQCNGRGTLLKLPVGFVNPGHLLYALHWRCQLHPSLHLCMQEERRAQLPKYAPRVMVRPE